MTLKEAVTIVADSSSEGEVEISKLICDLLQMDMHRKEETISAVLEYTEPNYSEIKPVMEFVKERGGK